MPPKRKGRKATKLPVSKKAHFEGDGLPQDEKEETFQDYEVERQSAAIRAIRDMEIEQLRTNIRLLKSNFSKEQLQVPVLQFFKENLPNLTMDESNMDVKWTYEHSFADKGTLHASLLHRLSIAYPDYSTGVPSLAGGFEFSNKSVKTGGFRADQLGIRSLVLEEPSESQINDGLQTPNVLNNNRLSVGITPKTVRLPKCGEVLLSVHGSPLGVYKEDNMETIQETEDG